VKNAPKRRRGQDAPKKKKKKNSCRGRRLGEAYPAKKGIRSHVKGKETSLREKKKEKFFSHNVELILSRKGKTTKGPKHS